MAALNQNGGLGGWGENGGGVGRGGWNLHKDTGISSVCFSLKALTLSWREQIHFQGFLHSCYCTVSVSGRCACVSDSREVPFAAGRASSRFKRTNFYKRKKETRVGLNIQREGEREEKRAEQR